MSQYYHPDTDYFRKLDVPLPTVEQHGTEEDVRANLKALKPHTWKLEGNQLIGITETGRFAQHIPTDYILTGTDSAGMPILQKIKL